MSTIIRGDIWLVDFDPTKGYEIKKIRPAIVIQNDIGNKYSPLTIVTPLTSEHIDKKYPTDVRISAEKTGIDKDSKALLNQIRTVDKVRLIKRIGRVDEETMDQIDDGLMISLGLTKI